VPNLWLWRLPVIGWHIGYYRQTEYEIFLKAVTTMQGRLQHSDGVYSGTRGYCSRIMNCCATKAGLWGPAELASF
jgi:hypothetical protein